MRLPVLIAVALLVLTLAHAQPASSASPFSVEGILLIGEFLGPPGYGDAPHDDRVEHSYFLQLPAPLVAQIENQDHADLQNPAGLDEYFVQLIVADADQKTVKKLIGKKVRANGFLQPALTGHHRTPLLLEVQSLSSIDQWTW